MTYDAVLFDHDGVLVSVFEDDRRVPAFRRQLLDAFQRDGLEPPDGTIISTLSHSVSYDKVLQFGEQLGLEPDQLWRYRDDTMADILTAATRDGRKRPYDDVGALEGFEIPLGIASNNQRRVVEFVLDQYDLAHHFGAVHARKPQLQSLREKKPRPTYLERAMRDLDVTNPLYVGDRESDIVAGQRASVDTAFLRRTHNAGASPGREPTYEVGGLDEVGAILDGSRAE
ncbi:MAG: HAD-IA family hydrolase [Halovenus sp.]